MVADTQCESTAASAFANADCNDRDRETGHLAQISGDGFSLAAFFGIDTGVCAGRIHQGDDGAVELGGQLHDADGFAVALWFGHAEVAEHFLLGVAAFLFGDDHDGCALEGGHAANDGLIVTEEAIAVEFLEVEEEALYVIGGVGAFGVAGKLDALPGGVGGSFDGLRGHLWFRIALTVQCQNLLPGWMGCGRRADADVRL